MQYISISLSLSMMELSFLAYLRSFPYICAHHFAKNWFYYAKQMSNDGCIDMTEVQQNVCTEPGAQNIGNSARFGCYMAMIFFLASLLPQKRELFTNHHFY